MKSALGLVPLIPSPDPVSLAFNAAAILGPMIKSFLGTGHLQANQIVPLQNKFHQEVLAPAVAAKDNPATSLEDLIYWRDLVRTEGEAFFHFTEKFDAAGPGARRTIFGEQDAAGNWLTTSNALGIATKILQGFNQVILNRTGGDMDSQLGIDWGRIAQVGVEIAGGIFGPGGSGVYIPPYTPPYVPPSQRPPTYFPAADALPSWLVPAGIGVLALVLLTRKR